MFILTKEAISTWPAIVLANPFTVAKVWEHCKIGVRVAITIFELKILIIGHEAEREKELLYYDITRSKVYVQL